jgi:hypothetical protein
VPDLTLQERLRYQPYRFAADSEDRVADHAHEAAAPAAVDQRYAVLRERPAELDGAGCVAESFPGLEPQKTQMLLKRLGSLKTSGRRWPRRLSTGPRGCGAGLPRARDPDQAEVVDQDRGDDLAGQDEPDRGRGPEVGREDDRGENEDRAEQAAGPRPLRRRRVNRALARISAPREYPRRAEYANHDREPPWPGARRRSSRGGC